MKLNKEKLAALAALPDDALWREIGKIAGGYGITLPNNTPSHEELEKLRGIVTADKINVGDAMKLMNEYRRKNGI